MKSLIPSDRVGIERISLKHVWPALDVDSQVRSGLPAGSDRCCFPAVIGDRLQLPVRLTWTPIARKAVRDTCLSVHEHSTIPPIYSD